MQIAKRFARQQAVWRGCPAPSQCPAHEIARAKKFILRVVSSRSLVSSLQSENFTFALSEIVI
jgi:hypothetical protein